MKRTTKLILALVALLNAMPAMAQKFTYPYNGTTVTYRILSVPNHEVEVDYVPENVTAVTIPAVVYFNGEAFKVTEVGRGGSRSGGLFGGYEGEGYYAFDGCKLLKSVVLPNTVKVIGRNAFRDCSWLREVVLPSGLEKICEGAFRYCESLSSITLPRSLKTLEEEAFYGCKSLKVLSFPSTLDTIGRNIVENTACRLNLPEGLGVACGDKYILKAQEVDSSYWPGINYIFGKKSISRNAFRPNYTVITISQFRNEVLSSPDNYLSVSRNTQAASLVKQILIEEGRYQTVLAYYPDDEEVNRLLLLANAKSCIVKGDEYLGREQYEEALIQYEQALTLLPNFQTARGRIAHVNEIMAEKERQRKETEEKARMEAERQQLMAEVDGKISNARTQIKQGNLTQAIGLLQEAHNRGEEHQYNYRTNEISERIDSIQHILALVADSFHVFDYKMLRPDAYAATDKQLATMLKSFLTERGKPERRNHLQLTLYSINREGAFLLSTSSKALGRFCREELQPMRLVPILIDRQPIKASADFDYSFEYAKGTVRAKQKNGQVSLNSHFNSSPGLQADMERSLTSRLNTLGPSCDGSYRFDVASVEVNDLTQHTFKLKSSRFANGPQNAWRSLFIPFWGDQYVGGGMFKDIWWMATLTCYAGVGLGIYNLITEVPQYNYMTETYEYKNRSQSYLMLGLVGAAWLGDVIYVWVKGAKNKRENQDLIRRFSLTYNPVSNAPEVVYSTSF